MSAKTCRMTCLTCLLTCLDIGLNVSMNQEAYDMTYVFFATCRRHVVINLKINPK